MDDRSRPTARQAEYLAFIRSFTDRWGIPPSFEEIGRHFMTTAPSVNSMVKTLEARGFLTRVPGQARTLRVLLPVEPQASAATSPVGTSSRATEAKVAVQFACMVIERLVPALRDVPQEQLWHALEAVREALETACLAAGASAKERAAAQDALVRTASIAQGMSPETRPGRRLPWWRRPR